MEIMNTISKENYLKTIYQIKKPKSKKVSTAHLAKRLEVSNAATSDMAKKLFDLGLVKYQPYRGVELTAKGEKLALNVIRRHRLWELFLIKTLNLSWSEVHTEAERLEHQASDFLIDRIDEYLDYPDFDPHGDPIPNKNGELPVQPDSVKLTAAEVGKFYFIHRVKNDDIKLLDYLTELGLKLNMQLQVLSRLEFDNSVRVKINNKEHSFSEKIAEKLSLVSADGEKR